MISEDRSTTVAGISRPRAGGLPAPLALAGALLMALLLAMAGLASPAAHAASQQAASPLAGHHSKYNFSRIAYTGSRIVIAGTDSTGDLYMFWQKQGTPAWHRERVARGGRGHRYAKPSIAWTGHAVAIAAVNTSGDLFYFAQPQGHSGWTHRELGTASGGKYGAPSIAAVADGPILISAARNSGKLASFELASSSSGWTKTTVASGNFGAPSIITCFDSLISQNLALITAPAGGTLDFWWERLDHTGWNQETVSNGASGVTFTGATLAATNKTILLTTSLNIGAVLEFAQAIGGSGWAGQTVAVGPGSTIYRNPQIAWTGATDGNPVSYDVITATTGDGSLVFWWADDGSTNSWTEETIASSGKHAAYANPGIAITSKSVVISVINSKPGNVEFWLQKFTTTPWREQLVAKG
jgi:hypothetical protein